MFTQDRREKMQSKNLTRRQFLTLTGATGIAVVLGACAPAPTAAPAAQPTAAPAATEAPKAEPTKAEATAAPAAAAAPKLLYFCGGNPQKDLPAVNEAMSAYLKERINATIELTTIEWGALTEKMKLKDAAGEAYDLCFCSSWANIYIDAVRNGVYADSDCSEFGKRGMIEAEGADAHTSPPAPRGT
jgi:ABC-type glycerol-3-phosphate transport system substrate-binding protein